MCSWRLCWENRAPKYFQRASFVSRITSVSWIVLKVRQDWRKRTNVAKKIKHCPHVQGLKMKCRGLGSEVPLQARSSSQVHSSGKLSNLIAFELSHLNNGALGQIDYKNSNSPLSHIRPMTMGFRYGGIYFPTPWFWDSLEVWIDPENVVQVPCASSNLRPQESFCVSVLFLSELWYHHKDKLDLDCWEKRDHVEQSQVSPFVPAKVTDPWEDWAKNHQNQPIADFPADCRYMSKTS